MDRGQTLKGQDLVVLLKLVSLESAAHGRAPAHPSTSAPTIRDLGETLGISKSEVANALRRSVESKLATKTADRTIPNRRNLCEFILHGLKYVFPVRPGAPQRGAPTGFAAPMLEGLIVSSGSDIHVWPWAHGGARGLAVTPLFESVPQATQNDAKLYEYLALVDAIRLGGRREENMARSRLEQELLAR